MYLDIYVLMIRLIVKQIFMVHSYSLVVCWTCNMLKVARKYHNYKNAIILYCCGRNAWLSTYIRIESYHA